MILLVLFFTHTFQQAQLLDPFSIHTRYKNESTMLGEKTLSEIDSLAKMIALGKISYFDENTEERLELAATLVQKDFFFKNPQSAPKKRLENTIRAEQKNGMLFFTEKLPIGIISEINVDVMPNAETLQEKILSSLYPLKNNRFAHIYRLKKNEAISYIDIYEKILFTDKMHRTEHTVVPEGCSVAYITSEEIAVIESRQAERTEMVFKTLSDQNVYSVLHPFRKLIAEIFGKKETLTIRGIAFAEKSPLVAVLLKIANECAIFVGHRTAENTPTVTIRPDKECHTCSWDAAEEGIITNAYYYKYPFALAILKAVNPGSLDFSEAKQVSLNCILHKVCQESTM